MNAENGTLTLALAALVCAVACSDPQTPPLPKTPFSSGLPSLQAPPWIGDIASGWFKSPLPAGDAQHILLHTKIFALGEMPPKRQVQAFNVIFEQPDAIAIFRYISEHAEPAGRLYAFAALSILARREAAALREILASRRDEIVLYDSDVIDRQPLAAIVLLIERRRVGVECRKLKDRTDEYFGHVRRTPDAVVSSARTASDR